MAVSSSSSTKFDVLSKACKSKFICADGNHREEVKRNQYILGRALVELKQLIKDEATHESNNGLSCDWLLQLDMELNYAFIQLLPFLNTRLMDVMHDDFVSAVHDAERSMKDYSNIVPVNVFFEELLNAVGPDELLGSFDDRKDIARLLLREWACTVSDRLNVAGEVVVCPSNSALISIVSDAAKAYGDTAMGLKRWVDEKVIPVLSMMLVDLVHGFSLVHNVMALYVETQKQTGELMFLIDI